MPPRKTRTSKSKGSVQVRSSMRKCKIEIEDEESSVDGHNNCGSEQTVKLEMKSKFIALEREESLDEEKMEALLGSLQHLGTIEDASTSGLSGPGIQAAPSQPYLEITEQPKQRDHRFRYPVEGRQAGSIMGEKGTQDLPSYPTVKVHNLTGRAKVVVSLVTKDDAHRPHPHRLVGDNCKDGVCSVMIDPEHPEAIFRKIGVQRTMNKEVEKSLAERKRAGVQLPTDVNKGKTGKKHNYDMKCVRLHFEVFLETRDPSGQYLTPVVSSPVYDKKDTVLTICRVNIRSGTVAGGDELFILCEKVQSEDIKVVFQGIDPDTQNQWSEYAIFGQSDVHRQFAVVCKTPAFVNQRIKAGVTVIFKLYRPSDEEFSNEMEFTYKPTETTYGRDDIEKKKRKFSHKDEVSYNKFFSAQGNPVKTETLGASAQSCSGNPVSTPVSNAPSTLAFTPVTTTTPDSASGSVRENLRQRIMTRNLDTGSRLSPSGGLVFSGGTAQPSDSHIPTTMTTTFSSGGHMSSGRMIQQQQPVSNDQGQFQLSSLSGMQCDILSSAMLIAQATGEMPTSSQLDVPGTGFQYDDERQTSEQMIEAIASQLMLESPAGASFPTALEGATSATPVLSGNGNVVVLQERRSLLDDMQFSGTFDTLDVAAIQEVSQSTFEFTYSTPGAMDMDTGNTNHDINPS